MKCFWENLGVARQLRGERGSALLTALLVMGILTAIGIAVSALVVREIAVTRLTLDAGRAYYSAESGVELALLQLGENLPGYEPAVDEDGVGEGLEVGDGEFTYNIGNKAKEYPYFGEEFNLEELEDPSALYDVLELNESITIPLFTVDSGEEVVVEDFRVMYYAGFDPAKDFKIQSKGADLLSGWDVLRWKIYGLKNEGTESISDFTAVTSVIGGGETGAELPSWFGSLKCAVEPGMHDLIECNDYFEGAPGEPTVSDDGQYIYNVSCLVTEAREHYLYDNDGVGVKDCYPIADFLEDHNYNYLTLTNLINPAVFKSVKDEERRQKARLYFRVEAYGDSSLVREYADITSEGRSGESVVTLNVKKKRDSYLPFLNFSLYHTAD
ncbi:hypothetical protein HOE67_03705 [Candidatus Peregrinibacteria bacterium]|jgi:hypothetical protein|nr:hypothetical protein [Candidatus Peregrinibacteria bacterium]MBT4056191.1 hypothetical protein [Candidatus Peregrinibacteria bacterium]